MSGPLSTGLPLAHRTHRRIALALSGGGLRATCFHLGLLGRLALEGLLDQVTFLSTVSGGSLAAGLVFHFGGGRWPGNQDYLSRVLPSARQLLTMVDLQHHVARRYLTRPWLMFSGRAHLVGETFADQWGISGLVKDLPIVPRWVINATSYESGRNWRFMRHRMGDYELGHVANPPIRTADAIAASAAFPALISYLVLRAADFEWYRYVDEQGTAREQIRPCVDFVHLWDGGVYDNLGLEAVVKPNREYRDEFDFLIVSDASARSSLSHPGFALFNARRLIQIPMEQVRSLRSRMVVERFVQRPGTGVYLQIGNSARDLCDKAGVDATVRERLTTDVLDDEAVRYAHQYPTDLRRVSPEAFECLYRHGWEVTNGTLVTRGREVFDHHAYGEIV